MAADSEQATQSMNQGREQWFLEGHAIVCAAGCIADVTGELPKSLQNDADWARFQAALNRSKAVILGRTSHEATPNRAGRLRIIVSRKGSKGLEHREDGWWWNPEAGVGLEEMLKTVVPDGGIVGVPGGRGVFDLLLRDLDAFDLSVNPSVRLEGGTPVLSGISSAEGAGTAFVAAGLKASETEVLEAATGVQVTRWLRGREADVPPKKVDAG